MNIVLVNIQIFILIIVLVTVSPKDIEILGTGILPIETGDVGFAPYVTIRNIGQSQLHVVIKMVECCETASDEETDCSFMHLMGGNMGFINPNITKNVTMIFPNMKWSHNYMSDKLNEKPYPYNRRGDCLVAIWYRDRYNFTYEERTNIAFNTFNINSVYEPASSDSSTRNKMKKSCDGVDLDPLDSCRPVDCHQKYNGERTFFSRLRNKCLPSPACYADPNKFMPDVAYLPVSNICRDLENAVTEEDVRYLTKASTRGEAPEPHVMKWSEIHSNIRCHHGVMSNITGLCTCDDGWTSPPIKDSQIISSTLLLHMCTIKKPTAVSELFNFAKISEKILSYSYFKVTMVGLGISFIAMILLSLCFPSCDEGYLRTIEYDDDASEEDKKPPPHFCSMSCSSASDTNTDYTNSSVDTYFLLLDKPGYELYTQGLNSNIYEEVVEDIVNEFSKQGEGTFSRNVLKEYNSGLSSLSSCSNFLIESASDDDDDIDSELLASLESEWEINEVDNSELNQKEEKTLLEEYLNQDKRKRKEAGDDSQAVKFQGTKSKMDIFERNPKSVFEKNKNQSTRNQLTKQLQSILKHHDAN